MADMGIVAGRHIEYQATPSTDKPVTARGLALTLLQLNNGDGQLALFATNVHSLRGLVTTLNFDPVGGGGGAKQYWA